MAISHRLRFSAAILAAAILAGCEVAPVPEAPTPEPETPIRHSAASLALQDRYAELERDLKARGLLRRDGGGPDTPFSQRDLVENFIRIALFDEYNLSGGRVVAQETPSFLHRWEQPVRVGLSFGEGVPVAVQNRDRAELSDYLDRLSQVSGHPIDLRTQRVNFHVLILNEDERARFGDRLAQIDPGLSARHIRTALQMERGTLCQVVAYSSGAQPGAYDSAIAVIRAEHPDLLRLSCIHEEIAQGLGLPNDSRRARPSIFNDDEEFGLLTYHDELLLKILYDARLSPGMTADQARPIVEEIAAELLGDSA